MSVILAFLVSVVAVAFWWLLRQGVMTKPWLETGPSPAADEAARRSVGPAGRPRRLPGGGRLPLRALRQRLRHADGRGGAGGRCPCRRSSGRTPAQLVLASLFLHMASASARRDDRSGLRRDMAVAALATSGFLVGQLLAWRQLTMAGDGLTAAPAASFFYLLSGLHGLHIIGGLVALGPRRVPGRRRHGPAQGRRRSLRRLLGLPARGLAGPAGPVPGLGEQPRRYLPRRSDMRDENG